LNRTIKEATVKRFHYDSHEQLRTHLNDFMAAYNFGRRLKTLSGLTPYEYVCKIWTSEPEKFIINPSNPRTKQIVYVTRNGLQWRDAPKAYGPHKTLYNSFIRWNRPGVFDRIFVALIEQAGRSRCLIIDATHLQAHRIAASLLKKGLFPAISGGQKAA